MRWRNVAALVGALMLGAWSAAADSLAVGDPAPEFVLVGAGGTEYRTADFKDRRAFVLAWFPVAFTPG